MMDLESRYQVILVHALQIQLNSVMSKIARYERHMDTELNAPGIHSPQYDDYLEWCAIRDCLRYYIKRFRADIVAHSLLPYI